MDLTAEYRAIEKKLMAELRSSSSRLGGTQQLELDRDMQKQRMKADCIDSSRLNV